MSSDLPSCTDSEIFPPSPTSSKQFKQKFFSEQVILCKRCSLVSCALLRIMDAISKPPA